MENYFEGIVEKEYNTTIKEFDDYINIKYNTNEK